jgi:hypothetical protein
MSHERPTRDMSLSVSDKVLLPAPTRSTDNNMAAAPRSATTGPSMPSTQTHTPCGWTADIEYLVLVHDSWDCPTCEAYILHLSKQDDPNLEVLELATWQIQVAYAARAKKELAVSCARLEESCNTIQTLLNRSEQAGVAVCQRKAQRNTAEDERNEMAACVKELEAEVEQLKQAASHGRPTEPRPLAPLPQQAATIPSPGPHTSAGVHSLKHPYNGRDEALAWLIAEVDKLAFDEEWDEEAEFDKEVE